MSFMQWQYGKLNEMSDDQEKESCLLCVFIKEEALLTLPSSSDDAGVSRHIHLPASGLERTSHMRGQDSRKRHGPPMHANRTNGARQYDSHGQDTPKHSDDQAASESLRALQEMSNDSRDSLLAPPRDVAQRRAAGRSKVRRKSCPETCVASAVEEVIDLCSDSEPSFHVYAAISGSSDCLIID